jgi:hypothetical protein
LGGVQHTAGSYGGYESGWRVIGLGHNEGVCLQDTYSYGWLASSGIDLHHYPKFSSATRDFNCRTALQCLLWINPSSRSQIAILSFTRVYSMVHFVQILLRTSVRNREIQAARDADKHNKASAREDEKK